MQSGHKNLVRHRINGLNLESAIGAVKPPPRMVRAQGRVDERLSLDPASKICLHRGDHQPEMFLTQLVQKAEEAHYHERRDRMLSVLYPNWGLFPVEGNAIVEMGANGWMSNALSIHLDWCKVVYLRLHAEDLGRFVA